MRWLAVSRALACLLAADAAPAWAATCDITPQSVSFGAYDPTEAGDLDGVGTVSIDCDVEVSVTITLSTGAAGSYAPRTMAGGADHIRYNLFTGPQRVVVWGDGSGGSATVSATMQNQDFTIYGTIPARQNVGAGAYADTVVVTITY
ncbi:MAG TPA: spore coat U domain-containing protein [Allosphingosinicella sp.]|nr:spore coat U domain-containing protein [Allosphingosinicella sp.]